MTTPTTTEGESMITYTHQEAFNIVWEHAKKGVKSSNGTRCFYRGPNGLKCFIGALIPDAAYSEALEHRSAVDALTITGINVTASAFLLQRLQEIHDKLPPSEWSTHLSAYASGYGLTVPA